MVSPVSECLYCQHLPALDELMIKICDLGVNKAFEKPELDPNK